MAPLDLGFRGKDASIVVDPLEHDLTADGVPDGNCSS
jgi:hypothetical protein